MIAEVLHQYVSAHGGFSVPSSIDIVFSDYDVLQPDVVLFTARRAHLVDLDRVIRDTPRGGMGRPAGGTDSAATGH